MIVLHGSEDLIYWATANPFASKLMKQILIQTLVSNHSKVFFILFSVISFPNSLGPFFTAWSFCPYCPFFYMRLLRLWDFRALSLIQIRLTTHNRETIESRLLPDYCLIITWLLPVQNLPFFSLLFFFFHSVGCHPTFFLLFQVDPINRSFLFLLLSRLSGGYLCFPFSIVPAFDAGCLRPLLGTSGPRLFYVYCPEFYSGSHLALWRDVYRHYQRCLFLFVRFPQFHAGLFLALSISPDIIRFLIHFWPFGTNVILKKTTYKNLTQNFRFMSDKKMLML